MGWFIVGGLIFLAIIGCGVLVCSVWQFKKQCDIAAPHILALLSRQSLRTTKEIYGHLVHKGWHGDCLTVAQILSMLTYQRLLRRNTLTSRNRAGEVTVGFSYELTALGRQALTTSLQPPLVPTSSAPS